MSQINPASSAAGVSDIIALRQQVIDRSELLKELGDAKAKGAGAASDEQDGFAGSLRTALDKVSETQSRAEALSEAYERGEVSDIAKVMMARQEAGLAFEATLQVRNRLLNAYQDIMRMGV